MLDFLYRHQKWLIWGFISSGFLVGIYGVQELIAILSGAPIPQPIFIRFYVAVLFWVAFGFLLELSDP
jgi:hypothetical protein